MRHGERLCLALALSTLPLGCRQEATGLQIAAAADLERALGEVITTFAQSGGPQATVTFGSSGLLAQQVAEGAPFDVFLSASAGFADRAIASGRCEAHSRRPYARGRLAVVTAPGVEPPATFEALAAPRFLKVAIANPEHAPYGQAALAALERAGLGPALTGRLLRGDNVRQALTYVDTGNAEVGLVALPLVADRPGILRVDEALHPPIEQVLVLCGRPELRAEAQRFADFLTGPEGQRILEAGGFWTERSGPPPGPAEVVPGASRAPAP